MGSSDPQRPPAADTASAQPDAPKGTEQLQEAPRADAVPPQPDEELLPSEAEFIERAHFEMLERETTQPVRPIAFDVPVQAAAPPEAVDPPPEPPAHATSDERPPVFEPAPFAVLPPTDAPPPVAPRSEPAPAIVEPRPAALPAASIDLPYQEPHREPVFEAPPLSTPGVQTNAAPVPAAPPRRDWRDLARRAAAVAFLIFAGWFLAVLLLILAYRFIDPPFSMLMAQRFLTGTSIDRQWVPIERISPNLSRAVIVAEDGRFCRHWGIDFVEAANAIRRSSTAYPRGASTITMQVAKNLFLVPAKSYLRKMIEIPLTFAIELAWPKWRILEIYLNIVEWGPGVFGAEAASRAHFGRSAASLTPRQAAQLAAVLPNPIVRDAGSPGPRTAHKASIIQARAARTREASACVDIRR
ncbi:MAG: monofunctional biosynthetic peptidoglycan transglycosylase [Hyphomicrobium sp.]|jgi:monofunctional biosynthetic peptidoglycan transglycosylase